MRVVKSHLQCSYLMEDIYKMLKLNIDIVLRHYDDSLYAKVRLETIKEIESEIDWFLDSRGWSEED